VEYLSGILKKRATIFLMSDFMSDEAFGQILKKLSRKHELISVVVSDPAESTLPNLGLIDYFDPETEEVLTLDSSSDTFRKIVFDHVKKNKEFRDAEFRKAQIDRIDIPNDENYVDPLLSYFRKRIF
jgi:hypothetical protein